MRFSPLEAKCVFYRWRLSAIVNAHVRDSRKVTESVALSATSFSSHTHVVSRDGVLHARQNPVCAKTRFRRFVKFFSSSFSHYKTNHRFENRNVRNEGKKQRRWMD